MLFNIAMIILFFAIGGILLLAAIPIVYLWDRIWNGKTEDNKSFKEWLRKF